MIPRAPQSRAAAIAFALSLPLYLATMNRTVGFIDRGELAAVAYTFGIPHATGYPTLMLLAGALAHLVPLRPVLVMNGLAALLAALGVSMLALLVHHVLARVSPTLAPRTGFALATLAALFVAVTGTWWQQANGFEVYALHAFLMPLVAWLCLTWCDRAAAEPAGADSPPTARAGFVFALLLGLSFTNHLTMILLAPGLLLYCFARLGLRGATWRRLLGLAPPFLLGLLPYLWLPIRSGMDPRFDWGDPETLARFVHHVTGADYRGWMFAEASTVVFQARYLLWRVPWDFAWVGLVVAGLGAALLARRHRLLAATAGAFVVAGAGFAVGYRIPDLDAYLMTVLLGVALCFGAGLLRVHERFGSRIALALGALLVLANGALHWRESDESGNRLVENFVHDLLGPLPRGAVLLATGWEFGEAATFYYQEVERYRDDVVVVSTELTRAAWYLDELERRQPELMSRAQGTLSRYRAALAAAADRRFESGDRAREARAAFLDELAAGALRDRPLFSVTSMPELRRAWRRVPYHLALRMVPDSSYVPEPEWRYAYQAWPGRVDLYTAQMCWAYGEARWGRALYEAHHGHLDAAVKITGEARGFDPRIRPERIGPQPLGTERTVLATARFFLDLERRWGALAAAR